ncbi:hypothetical protein [Rhizobium leguminosarum]|uniref:hypothetical protein n=1 Tax=Rhizobium leguminosarum TaxID=384 RepID=UPI0021BBE9AC|nr:hypothetical protein [Rhizobium leguminosarum]
MARPNPESALRFPLSTILGNETNVRVMRELSLHGGQLSVGNLINRTKISRPPILASLATLTSFQIVTESGTGYARLFSLNRGSPFSTPVQALFETEETFANKINQNDHAAVIKTLRDALGNRLPKSQETRLTRILGNKDLAQYGGRFMLLSDAESLFEQLKEYAEWVENEMTRR